MRISRTLLLAASGLIVLGLLGGGLNLKLGAAENSYRQAVLFAEILSQVLDNYVDPVEADALLHGAYQGMLGALDPNGAFLTAEEVAAWKASPSGEGAAAGPGVAVLKGNAALQVVAVTAGSPAAEAGIAVGDQIRSIGGHTVRHLSLEQSRRLLAGPPGSSVSLEVLHPDDGFRREELSVVRVPQRPSPYDLSVERGTAVLRIRDLRDFPLDEAARELDDVRSRPVERLLVDLRNLVAGGPRDAASVATLFVSRPRLELRDRAGRLIDTVEPAARPALWSGSVAVLVNGATADGAEALALLLSSGASARTFGQGTFGLGAEARLFELQNGSGVLLSAALWETAGGVRWHEDGVKPDEAVEGEGRDLETASADQLQRVLGLLDAPPSTEVERKAA